MEEKEKILTENFNEYFSLAMDAYNKKKFNAATTLFFKSIVVLCDLYILKKEGVVPSSHSNRFRIMQERYQVLYKIADRDFPFYQDSYTKKMDEETAKLLKEDAESIKQIVGI
jgi:hypothetical protein